MQALRTLVTLALSIFVAACAYSPAAICKNGEQSSVHDTLYFGTSKPSGVVTDGEWSKFLETVVTPRFAQGLTVSHASGQWRGSDGSIVRESTHILQLAHAGDTVNDRSVTEIAAEYKAQFQQEAVLRVRASTCVSF